MAHYHMGGIRVDVKMRTRVRGLFAAGEAVGGANGANRLSGNAITEAFVFGARAGSVSAEMARRSRSDWNETFAANALSRLQSFASESDRNGIPPISLQAELQKLMWEKAGPFRTGEKLAAALARIEEMQKKDLSRLNIRGARQFNLDLQDGFELRAMLATAETVVRSALGRTESRGAHQREDFPAPNDAYLQTQVLERKDGKLESHWLPPVRVVRSSANDD
jgi:succinate dehydrogenase/fumarate reductase flavoprotein subunit